MTKLGCLVVGVVEPFDAYITASNGSAMVALAGYSVSDSLLSGWAGRRCSAGLVPARPLGRGPAWPFVRLLTGRFG
jgi:hypothetical protein